MKIKRETLIEKMTKVASVANYKDAKGIIRIDLTESETGNAMVLFGSDGINSAMTHLAYNENVGGGTFYLDSKKVINYLRNLGAFEIDEIDMDFGEKEITITTGKAKFNFPVEVVKDYPQMVEVNLETIEGNKYTINCDSQIFHRKMVNMAKTVGGSERAILMYCNVIASSDSMNFVTSDGFRASLATMKAEAINLQTRLAIESPVEFNINPNILSRLLTPVSGIDVTMLVTNDLIYVVDSESAITLKTIKESFPNVRRMMPEVDFESGKVPFKAIYEVEGKELNNALALLRAVLSNEKNKRICFELGESCKVESTQSKDQGKIQLGGVITGEAIKINFDILKLDVLNNGIEKLRIGLIDKESPIYVYDASEVNNFSNAFMLMPML